ncbi:unnamed protein product [Adineta steineri]|uniref:HMG box domain-containing protein n=1 Tax=Adineta steineri TaxID=433720 RepID=A0A813NFZ2_9BILA|nr:unnamed protein product [Adineta steineri]CAF1093825.1 unnamed protein product [Adineta steineri]
MWAAGGTNMIARLSGSTLFGNHSLLSVLTIDQRSVSTADKKPSSDSHEVNLHLLDKMRNLRAPTPYSLYIKENYHDISAKYPNIKLGEMSIKMAEHWKTLTEEQRQVYSKKSQEQKALYEDEKKHLSDTDLKTVHAEEKIKKIEQQVRKLIKQIPTKKPRSAYIHYISSLDRAGVDLKDFMKTASEKWAKLSDTDRKKYEDIYLKEKREYTQDLLTWAATNLKPTVEKTQRSPVKRTGSPSSKKSTPRTSDDEASSSDDESSSKTKKSTRSKRS